MTLEERLTLENQILIRDGLSQFRVYSHQNRTSYFLWGEHKTSINSLYSIWSPLPTYFPTICPPVYVYKPNPLAGYGGKTLNSYGISYNMHTLGNGPNGEVQICHWRQSRWHSGITLNKVALKVILWLEAYEQHLYTGRNVCEFVRTMPE